MFETELGWNEHLGEKILKILVILEIRICKARSSLNEIPKGLVILRIELANDEQYRFICHIRTYGA